MGSIKRKLREPFITNTFRGNLQIFVGVGDVALAWRDPVTERRGANHVSNEFVFLAIPGKENGTRTAAAVEFTDRNDFHGGEVDFILWNTRGPEKTDGVGDLLRAETNEQRSAVLAQIAGGRRKFKFLVGG